MPRTAVPIIARFIVVLAFVVPAAQADTINVPADYPTIQAAINAANTGDEVVVASGTYNETINMMGKAITLRSTDPEDPAVVAATIIDAQQAGSVITCNSGEGLDTVISGLTVTGGFAEDGAGVKAFVTSPTLSRCVFVDNEANGDGGGLFSVVGAPVVSSCRFERNVANRGGALSGVASSITVTGAVFLGNLSGGGGAVYLQESNGLFHRCRFLGNTAEVGGGVALWVDTSQFVSCEWSGNTAPKYYGGACFIDESSTEFINNTFANNSSPEWGWIASFHSTLSIANSIAWDNGPFPFLVFSGDPVVEYSCIEGSFPGVGNTPFDPSFADARGLDGLAGTEDDDLRPIFTSPAIDAGDNTALPSGVGTDLGGFARFVDQPLRVDTGVGPGPIVDMGAYELQQICYGDADADRDVDLDDLQLFLFNFGSAVLPYTNGDADGDGDVDLDDLQLLLFYFGSSC